MPLADITFPGQTGAFGVELRKISQAKFATTRSGTFWTTSTLIRHDSKALVTATFEFDSRA